MGGGGGGEGEVADQKNEGMKKENIPGIYFLRDYCDEEYFAV